MIVKYIIKRILYMIPTVFFISLIAFIIIQLPPGSWIDSYLAHLTTAGQTITREQIAAIESRYGMKDPFLVAYWKWIRGWPRGDFGRSPSGPPQPPF
jgi:peptide/nickel transport system permease protein